MRNRNPGTQKTFVLVHGAWQGAWCWDGVREHLRTRGHRVLAPTLPGRGAVADDRSWIGPGDNVAAVLLALDTAGDEPVAHLVEIDGDHEVMLTAPIRLADALHHASTPASGRAA